jgi:hypothetical protein
VPCGTLRGYNMSFSSVIRQSTRAVLRGWFEAPPLGRRTKGALYFAMVCGFWLSFKQIEASVFPVVTEFEILHAVDNGDTISISGEFNKVRDCRFVDLQGYSGGIYVQVIFPRYPTVSRLPRHQTFGPWVLSPKTVQLDLYSRHICATGTVVTRVFSGALVR